MESISKTRCLANIDDWRQHTDDFKNSEFSNIGMIDDFALKMENAKWNWFSKF